jgi:hypothetical protein
MISAALFKKYSDLKFISDFEATWAATIAFSVIGIVVSLVIFILNILKIPKNFDFEYVMSIIVN